MGSRIGLIIGLACIVCAAHADQFQITTTSDSFDVSYLKVELKHDGSSVFTGMTDKIGRITVDGLTSGRYQAELQDSKGNRKSVTFEISGDRQLKTVPLQ